MHPEPRAQGSLEKRLFKVTESSFFSLSSLKWKIPDINSRNTLRPTSLSSVFNTRGNQHWQATFRQWAMNLVFLSTKSEIQTCCSPDREEKGMSFFPHPCSFQTIQWSFDQHAQVFKSKSICICLRGVKRIHWFRYVPSGLFHHHLWENMWDGVHGWTVICLAGRWNAMIRTVSLQSRSAAKALIWQVLVHWWFTVILPSMISRGSGL